MNRLLCINAKENQSKVIQIYKKYIVTPVQPPISESFH